MTSRSGVLAAAIAIASVGSSVVAAQGATDPIAWSLAVEPAASGVAPGGTVTLTLTATIDEGWHLYPTSLEPGGPIETSITVPKGQVVALSGPIDEPPTASAFDPNFNRVLDFHEGKTVFSLPVKVAPDASGGPQSARVLVKYQTCNDRLCLPVREVTVSTNVTVVRSGGR